MMIKCLYLSMEMLAYLLLLNDLFDTKFKLDIPAASVVVTEVVLFVLATGGNISQVFLFIPYIMIFFYCKFKFHSPFYTTIINMLIAFMALGTLQLVVGSFSLFVENKDICAVIINVADFIIALILVKYRVLFNIFCYVKENSRTLARISIYIGILFLFLFICYWNLRSFTLLEYFLIVVIYVFFIGVVKLWKKEYEKLKYKTDELKVFNEFHEQEKQLYSDVRKRQHEFKKQLNAIYSTHYTCSTYEELVDAQSKYVDWLIRDNKYNDLLLSCKPSVLAGFIYSQLEYAKSTGIQVDYSIFVEDMDSDDREYDYICVFGILFDNAMEALQDFQGGEPKINCVFTFDGLHTKIVMENSSTFIKNEEIGKWFKDTYSTKGKNRGYGLSNIVDIKNKYNADIIVKNIEKETENWISVQFIID